ncbi:MAG: hypothetical protein O6763_10630, partial [Gammaproteobacteria bacterium]|nr:hypothetical protein [Gammaproteobacteria bacterium]
EGRERAEKTKVALIPPRQPEVSRTEVRQRWDGEWTGHFTGCNTGRKYPVKAQITNNVFTLNGNHFSHTFKYSGLTDSEGRLEAKVTIINWSGDRQYDLTGRFKDNSFVGSYSGRSCKGPVVLTRAVH